MDAPQTIDHLSKVTLALNVHSPTGTVAPPRTRQMMTFVYGIGSQGLTAFEQRLHGRCSGDTLAVRVDRHALGADFEHLGLPLVSTVGTPPPFDLEIEIKSVAAASDLEVVKALAQRGGSNGCGGGCGCGC